MRPKSPHQPRLTNKERFDTLEQRMASLTTALENMATTQTRILQAPIFSQSPLHSAEVSQHASHPSRTSTPKPPSSARRALNADAKPLCEDSFSDDPVLSNSAILNSHKTDQQADRVARKAAARFHSSHGKPIFDTYLNRQVNYHMPRHFLQPHSQRRVRALESFDELTLSEYLQGFCAMIL